MELGRPTCLNGSCRVSGCDDPRQDGGLMDVRVTNRQGTEGEAPASNFRGERLAPRRVGTCFVCVLLSVHFFPSAANALAI